MQYRAVSCRHPRSHVVRMTLECLRDTLQCQETCENPSRRCPGPLLKWGHMKSSDVIAILPGDEISGNVTSEELLDREAVMAALES